MKKARKNTRLVYSTEKNWEKKYCPECGLLLEECLCKKESPALSQGVIYLERSKKGRGGKTVTVVTGFQSDLKEWKKKLQQLCASGGTIKDESIEVQGDHREKIKTFLEKEGLKVKLKGG